MGSRCIPSTTSKLVESNIAPSVENGTNLTASLIKHNPICPPPRLIRALPFQPLIHQRNLPKYGAISPLRFDEICNAEEEVEEEDGDTLNNTKDSPPVVEILFSKPQPIDGSTCSNNEDATPVTTGEIVEDYKYRYCCSQRENHALRGHVSWMQEENRQLKRSMIEMQKHLYSLTRNKSQAIHHGRARHSGWIIPPSSVSKRRKIRFDSDTRADERVEEYRVPNIPNLMTSGSTLSSIGVTTSISAEDNLSDSR